MHETSAPERKWVPSIFIEDVSPIPRGKPEDWITKMPNGGLFLFSDDAIAQKPVPIGIGDVVRFRWFIDHGTFTVKFHLLGGWSCEQPLPEGANGFMEPGDPDSYAETMDEFAENAIDAWSIADFETGDVRVFTWSEDIHFRLDKLASMLSFNPVTVSNRGETFQAGVGHWMIACFGREISNDQLERGDRFLEEALELLQSGDYPRDRIAALTKYVFDRPKGEPFQEVGGVMVTLAAYCRAHGLEMDECGNKELDRIWGKVEQIRAKQAAKPTGSALPIVQPTEA